jgi:hypothetical protein
MTFVQSVGDKIKQHFGRIKQIVTVRLCQNGFLRKLGLVRRHFVEFLGDTADLLFLGFGDGQGLSACANCSIDFETSRKI